MKLAIAIAEALKEHGLRHVFGVSGGANLHLIHAIYDTKIQFVPTAHEQGASFAADGYARVSGFGCALATSGPGATNLITGIATSYYDSIPVLYLTGNVATDRFGSRLGVRQYGFQDTPIVEMVRGITKEAIQLAEPRMAIKILHALIKAARAGRPGPVLFDVPDDLQRAQI